MVTRYVSLISTTSRVLDANLCFTDNLVCISLNIAQQSRANRSRQDGRTCSGSLTDANDSWNPEVNYHNKDKTT